MTIGVAIIGGGIFAREEHLPAVNASEHLTLKAVYSRSLKSAQSLATDTSKLDLYSDDSGDGKGIDDLLKRDDIAAVIVALPILNQPSYIRAALTAGKHVFSEKPIAPTVSEANELIEWYHSSVDTKKTTWAIAENFRFLNSIAQAADMAKGLGKLWNFDMRMNTLLEGGKYFETPWRKIPSHQGGFILDGGVHNIAGLRQLLPVSDPITHVSSFTSQNQPHLPPLDTVSACARTRSGATGTISISFGTTLKGNSYSVGYEKGSIVLAPAASIGSTAKGGKAGRGMNVTRTEKGGEEKSEKIEDEGSGVKPEVRAWGEALSQGKTDSRQSPEQALADLEILEAIFRSGEQNGAPQELKHQSL